MAILREIQLVELEMLRLLDKVCQENNLNYSMIGGTMLGAIRHNGFIPWDDDIDVYMPIEDFNKLKSIFNEEGFFLQTPETDIQSPYIMYKIRKNGTSMPDKISTGIDIHNGVWLDIFTYCNAGNSKMSKFLQRKSRALLQSYRCRYMHTDNIIKALIRWFLKKPNKKIQLWFDRLLVKNICNYGKKNTHEIFAIDVVDNTFFKASFFTEQDLYLFEGYQFAGVKDFDSYLTQIYGSDYMTPKKWDHKIDYSNVIL